MWFTVQGRITLVDTVHMPKGSGFKGVRVQGLECRVRDLERMEVWVAFSVGGGTKFLGSGLCCGKGFRALGRRILD